MISRLDIASTALVPLQVRLSRCHSWGCNKTNAGCISKIKAVEKVRFDETRILAACRDGILVWDMRTNGGLGPEGNKPIRKLHPSKYTITDIKMKDYKIGYCGLKQVTRFILLNQQQHVNSFLYKVVMWDERLAFQPTAAPSAYQGYTFYEHRGYDISALQFDESKVLVSLLDGTGTVEMLEHWTPPQQQQHSTELSSVLKSYRRLAIDVDKEKKKYDKVEAITLQTVILYW